MGYRDNHGRSLYSDGELGQTKLQPDCMQQGALLKKTTLQRNGWEKLEKQTRVQPTCPRCHYPMIGNFCANCAYEKPAESPSVDNHKDLAVERLTCKCQNCGKEVAFSFRFCPDCGTEIEKRTINPFNINEVSKLEESKHQCSLTLLNEVEGDLKDGEIKEYTGNSIILTRDNTESGNRTISKEHAELVYEDEGWTILNRSGYGATMVAANRKISLQSGDIILLGNRRFRFNVIQ